MLRCAPLLLSLLSLLLACSAHAQTPDAADGVGERFRAAAAGWDGTSYRFGGTRLAGIDCSALMVRWFDHLYGVRLPRTSRAQFRAGTPVSRDRLAEGDLVFFGSPSRITHVGVYVGRGEFAHASSSQGVTVSRMDGAYWQRHYRGARRVLSGYHAAPPPAHALALPPRRTFAAGDTSRTRPLATERAAGAAPTFTTQTVGEPRPRGRRIGW